MTELMKITRAKQQEAIAKVWPSLPWNVQIRLAAAKDMVPLPPLMPPPRRVLPGEIRRDQTMTVLRFGARLTRAHRRGNVTPVLINPRRRHLYLNRHGRREIALKAAA